MKIFVGYGFNRRDQWIPRLVFPIIRAFGAEVVTGEQVWSGTISSVVMRRIDEADAVLAFATRRGSRFWGGPYETHRWVTDELTYALARRPPIPVVEVREKGVSPQRGLAGDRQPVVYDQKQREQCLVDIAQVVGSWCRGVAMDFHLLPKTFQDEVRPFLEKRGFRCTYQLLVSGRTRPVEEGQIVPRTGGLYLYARGLPLDALIDVCVQAEGRSWRSGFEPIGSRSITLHRD